MGRGFIVGLAVLLLASCSSPVGKSNNANNGSSNGGSNNGDRSSNGGSNNGGCDIATPEFHRADHAMCDDEREPGTATTNSGAGECQVDDDCTDGRNGRCLEEPRSNMTYCSYDACLVDDDCGTDGACDCGAEGSVSANACLPGNCVTDADCGATGYCSPSQGDCGAYVGIVGYFCHTCEDECVTDADCGGDPYTTYCAYDPGVGHWMCSDSQCAG